MPAEQPCFDLWASFQRVIPICTTADLDEEAAGELRAFLEDVAATPDLLVLFDARGRSVVVIIGIDIIAIVVVVMIGKAGERSFTRGRWLVDVHYGSNCLIKAVPKCYRGVMLQHACA